MSQPSFDPMGQPPADVASTPAAVKRPLDIYTLMMLFAAIAMIAGTIILFMELGRWGSFSEMPWNTASAQPSLPSSSQ